VTTKRGRYNELVVLVVTKVVNQNEIEHPEHCTSQLSFAYIGITALPEIINDRSPLVPEPPAFIARHATLVLHILLFLCHPILASLSAAPD
jgi:hypothetical protein